MGYFYHNRVFSFRINYKVDAVRVPNDEKTFICVGETGFLHSPILMCVENQIIYCWDKNLEFVNSSYSKFLQTMAYVEEFDRQIDEAITFILADNSKEAKVEKANNIFVALKVLEKDLLLIDDKALEKDSFWYAALMEYYTVFPVFDVLEKENPFQSATFQFLPSETKDISNFQNSQFDVLENIKDEIRSDDFPF